MKNLLFLIASVMTWSANAIPSLDAIEINAHSESSQCESLLDSASFDQLLRIVHRQEFDDKKREAIEQAVKGKCLKIKQIVSLLRQFSFEEDRITLAKMFWDHTDERLRFEEVIAVFEFESSKKEVRKFIAERK